ncbi:LacI family DNA-binding transcriptional regulator [Tessaracoccus rhinocerotis]|uniref:LacI family DNA-binding transcriptional regulator n=1 Tax=Tessaracoccus rhinocerotis TaxID=1689449 RepID=UPI001C8F8EBF|nr:LacI family DNA-binding transcriptional regulator [Tessaracoccus rhinocerotis]
MTDTKATIADVARAAGVSRAAVSKVLRSAYGVSDAMRTKVQAAIDELGYRPRVAARAMRGSSYILGIEIPNTANMFLDRVLRSLASALVGTPYRVIIAPAGEDENSTKAIQELVDYQVDGILAIGANASPDWLEEQGRMRPLVMLGRHEPSSSYDTIGDDDVLGTRLLMGHLHELGHRRIAHLSITTANHPHMWHSSHAVRSRTYDAIMREFGLGEQARTVLVTPTEEAAYQRTLVLLEEPNRPTAIFAGHDELALGVLRAVVEKGLSPADVSVVGYDDSSIASHPLVSLTTIRQSADVIGSLVAQMLLERIAGRTEAVHTVLTPELRVRRSTAPPLHSGT